MSNFWDSLTLTKAQRIAQATTWCVQCLAETFEKPSRVSRAVVYSVYMARLRIKVELTKCLVYYHEQFLGLSNFNQGVEDHQRSIVVCTNYMECLLID